MNVQKTSLEAYNVLLPELGKKQNMVLNILKMYPDSSNRELSEIMEKPINQITPRVKELRDKGLVICSGHKLDDVTNKRVMKWKAIC